MIFPFINSICLSFGVQNNNILTTPSSFFTKPSRLFLQRRRSQSFNVSCNNANNVSGDEHDKNVDRRNVLLGLGGLYGVSNLELAPLASASPVPSPDLKSCSKATISRGPEVPYSCCPPIPDNIDNIPYYNLSPMSTLRKRPAAQDVNEEYIAKYQLAIKKMKELDKHDPLGFNQQANIHCAYCNGAYKIGDKVLQVHQSWLFFPFHRWYLYFYERILGKLINDPTFALPYWNWDHPKGMRLPPMFDREGTSLYDERRNPHVSNGTIIDLGSFGDEVQTTELQTLTNNLTLMYRQMVTNAPCPLQFFGARYALGTDPKGQGTIENIPHTPVHIWTGTVRGTNLGKGATSYGEDMGNFYSAGLDPVFFSHHANVDRMWIEWKKLGGKRRDLIDTDWLNSEFFFYDENRNPYRVRVRDCLDYKKMGYDYEPTAIPWRNFKPTRKSQQGKVMNLSSIPSVSKVFPLAKLDKVISFSINRPATSRSQKEKNEKEEVLTFKGIKYDNNKYIRFDVFLNADETVNVDELDKVEFAGSYVSLPHVHAHNMDSDEPFRLAITELLEDNGLEDDATITVTVVPKKGGEVLSIQSVDIEFVDG